LQNTADDRAAVIGSPHSRQVRRRRLARSAARVARCPQARVQYADRGRVFRPPHYSQDADCRGPPGGPSHLSFGPGVVGWVAASGVIITTDSPPPICAWRTPPATGQPVTDGQRQTQGPPSSWSSCATPSAAAMRWPGCCCPNRPLWTAWSVAGP
jgi:hypothetical protein